MLKLWQKQENRVLIALLTLSISLGIWNNYKQLWMQNKGLDVSMISKTISIGTFM